MISDKDRENLYEWTRDINRWINENDLESAIIMSKGMTKALIDIQKKEKNNDNTKKQN